MTQRLMLGLIACVLGACRGDDRQPAVLAATPTAAALATPPAVPPVAPPVAPPDRQYDIARQLRRFRDSVGDHPAALADAAASRDALVIRFVRAVEAADTTALERMQLSAGEFGYFYYPDSKLSRPPYELDPQLMWMQIQTHGDRGLARLLRRYGGKTFGFPSLQCLPPEPQGESLLHDCRVRHATNLASPPLDERLFGTILERRGRFKFVSYANKL